MLPKRTDTISEPPSIIEKTTFKIQTSLISPSHYSHNLAPTSGSRVSLRGLPIRAQGIKNYTETKIHMHILMIKTERTVRPIVNSHEHKKNPFIWFLNTAKVFEANITVSTYGPIS